jgi:hypothetical protein
MLLLRCSIKSNEILTALGGGREIESRPVPHPGTVRVLWGTSREDFCNPISHRLRSRWKFEIFEFFEIWSGTFSHQPCSG